MVGTVLSSNEEACGITKVIVSSFSMFSICQSNFLVESSIIETLRCERVKIVTANEGSVCGRVLISIFGV